jgi:hypothetical protein
VDGSQIVELHQPQAALTTTSPLHRSSCRERESGAMAAAAMGLVRELVRPQGTTGARRLCGTAVGVAAGFLSAATVASASDGRSAGAACLAYPWSPQDG